MRSLQKQEDDLPQGSDPRSLPKKWVHATISPHSYCFFMDSHKDYISQHPLQLY